MDDTTKRYALDALRQYLNDHSQDIEAAREVGVYTAITELEKMGEPTAKELTMQAVEFYIAANLALTNKERMTLQMVAAKLRKE